ncbi:MAG: sigma-70 family RNA polymerase sigma factor [Cytophagaceae bacterium]|jgi:RNA polymerase sigma-70 factor (ECF subfamily)|nr:sigma-70 family RNA polymerase sigma factor [Cytophagaceae bacterium]
MLSEQEIIKGCKDFDPLAQQLLYKKYVGTMRMVCLRYSKDREEAKDLLQEGFIKIYTQISKFNNAGSLEGWMKRVMVNTAITHFHKSKKMVFEPFEPYSDSDSEETKRSNHVNLGESEDTELESEVEFTHEELLEALNQLPEGYRLVFNMYHIEEYSHAEIGKFFGYDERTSRTRLFRARKMLQDILQQVSASKIDR